MSSDRSRQHVTLRDGRSLCFAEFGDPDGFPLLSLHGTPGSRYDRYPDESLYLEQGARLITYDRPGYGESDRLQGRQIVHCVDDVVQLLEHLGIERFSVTGGSGGGPHALAVAARLGPRIHRAQCDVGIAPYGSEGLDWLAGMDPMNVHEFGLALEGEEPLRAWMEVELAGMLERVEVDPATLLGDFQLSEADRAAMSRPEVAESIRQSVAEMCRRGPEGWIDDDLSFTDPDWGFELSEIEIPVQIAYGVTDVLVPAAHGEWLVAHVPYAVEDRRADEGHMGDLDKVAERVRWFVPGPDDQVRG